MSVNRGHLEYSHIPFHSSSHSWDQSWDPCWWVTVWVSGLEEGGSTGWNCPLLQWSYACRRGKRRNFFPSARARAYKSYSSMRVLQPWTRSLWVSARAAGTERHMESSMRRRIGCRPMLFVSSKMSPMAIDLKLLKVSSLDVPFII